MTQGFDIIESAARAPNVAPDTRTDTTGTKTRRARGSEIAALVIPARVESNVDSYALL